MPQRTIDMTMASACDTQRGYDTWNGLIDEQFYPIQANCHGGIGQVLATGRKVGKNVMTTDAVAAGRTGKLGNTVMGLSGKLSSFQTDDQYFKHASRDWEARDKGGPVHSRPFVATIRPSRVHDWRRGGHYSKWDGLSSYENDMQVIQNHIQVMKDVENHKINGLDQVRWEREEKSRLQGNQAREMFYQRRIENESRRMEPHLLRSTRSCATSGQPFQVSARIEFEKSAEYSVRKSTAPPNHHSSRVYPGTAKTVYNTENERFADKRKMLTHRAAVEQEQQIQEQMAELDEFTERLAVHAKNARGGRGTSAEETADGE
eukprot:jgi/Tetstr1/433100/TSEL_022432.t1